MGIHFDKSSQTFTLTTENTVYQMQIGPLGYLLHLYYGRRAEGNFGYLHLPWDRGFSPNPYELQTDRGWSLDCVPQEYSGSNGGDYRLSSLRAETEDGIRGADFRCCGHEIRQGKYRLDGLPCAFAREGEAETLSVRLKDAATGLEAELLYAAYERQDVISRAVRITNKGSSGLTLRKAASACLDLPFGDWEMIHFHGRHAMERSPERVPLMNGIQTLSSLRGYSSHQHNPFAILCEPSATEDSGECLGLMLVYSGSFAIETEQDQSGSVRITAGIQSEGFSWQLEPGESFETPEVLLSFSHSGLTELSQVFHRFIRRNVCQSRFTDMARPILLNSWEAVYFDFDEKKILELARDAAALGLELLVMDDGWFGQRDDDRTSLGDWDPDPRKFPSGLPALTDRIHDLGLKFGIWAEPEMISERSELYRQHPDWALTVPGRSPSIGRNQLVLDLSRNEVCDWLYEKFSALLLSCRIDYVKWDMNRSMADIYSHAMPAGRQGEVGHRYMLGLYSLLQRLTTEFPEVLFEGCAGGGGRFDAAMLAFFPQIWCSDNTDPIARLNIQQGTSFGYPVSTMGAHVSASPNHQTGRRTPLGTRAVAAMEGTFGYELDPAKLTEEEKKEIGQQTDRFHRWQTLINEGSFYRLSDAFRRGRFTAWAFVAEDRGECLFSLVVTEPEANPRPLHLRLKGLEPDARYRLEETVLTGSCAELPDSLKEGVSGAALMYAGFTIPALFGDYPAIQMYWKRDERS
ncbi:MAG: alpha-galactosidase [Oscillospiraceae bacterium]|nr:alpha-galactosidase [Oscillospiraceae bacterium]